MSILAKPCPRCKGRGKVANMLLPGRHACRRCDGAGELPTIWGRLAEAVYDRLSQGEAEELWP